MSNHFPMPVFPDLIIRMDETPDRTARRWNRQMAEFKTAWDTWVRNQALVEMPHDPALPVQTLLLLVQALLATLTYTQLLLIKALEGDE